jgi:hypothetical protein
MDVSPTSSHPPPPPPPASPEDDARQEENRNRSTDQEATPIHPGEVAGARYVDITQPRSWIPANPDDIPAFITWLSTFQVELEGVKQEARKILVEQGGTTSLLRAYQEEMLRRRRGDSEIARLQKELEKHKHKKEDNDDDKDRHA